VVRLAQGKVPVNPLKEVQLILLRELRKNFRSVKGIVLLLISLFGSFGAALLLVKFQQFKRTQLGEEGAAAGIGAEGLKELVHNARIKGLTPLYGEVTAKYIADSPEVLFAGLLITIWLTPLLIALLGFDSFSGDVQHRSVRYWTVRTRRGSFFAGKFLGLWSTVSAVTLAIHALIWGVCIARGEATAAETLSWGIRFWVVSLPMSAAWCGIAVLVSSFFRMPIVALLTTFAVYFGLWLVWVIGNAADVEPLLYLYPNFYDKLLLSPQLWTAAAGFGACALMSTLCIGGGTFLFSRRDV
jgi:ABC-type transport system involved in multi-copper enzyme maturation permease subunit